MPILNPPQYSEFSSLIEKHGLHYRINFPWIFVGQTDRTQGWKLHLSSIITEAENLLSCVIPILKELDITFKCAFNKEILIQLNEGSMGSSAVGKFITIYPKSDDEACVIANKLKESTKGFHGPVILTDLKLGEILYARYGSFNAIMRENRVGIKTAMIYQKDGSLVPDEYTIPFRPPTGISNPFENIMKKKSNDYLENKDGIFGPGYLLVNVIKKRSRGSVFWAVDVKNMKDVKPKIVKEGRKYCLSDEFGRDMRYRLRRQEQLHKKLHDKVPLPDSDSYFEVDENGYLPLEYIKGQSFLSLVQKNQWKTASYIQKIRILNLLLKALSAVSKLHKSNYVHRDLTLQNLWIGDDETVYLLDLELAHDLSDDLPPISGGTPGFVSIRQKKNESPSIYDDVFTVGADLIYIFTGIEPRKIFYVESSKRFQQLRNLIDDLPLEFIKTITLCVEDQEDKRPGIEEIINVVEKTISEMDKTRKIQNKQLPIYIEKQDPKISVRECIEGGIKGILFETITQNETGLWLTPTGKVTDTIGSYELKKDCYKGIAGVLYLFSKAKKLGFANQVDEKVSRRIANWLVANTNLSEEKMPGLYFGTAGIGVSLASAINSGSIEQNQSLYNFIVKSLDGPIDMLDITHGAAGQGLAVLNTAKLLGDQKIANLSHRYANHLLSAQNKDGYWQVFENGETMSSGIYTGFAHGVAGIIYFLAEYSKQFHDKRSEEACKKGSEWLLSQSTIAKDGNIDWHRSTSSKAIGKWWCHGSLGIALSFLKLYELTRIEKYEDIVEQILSHYSNHIAESNFGFCHGISGIGGVFLEANRLLHEKKWYDNAYRIIKILNSTYKTGPSQGFTWLVDDPYLPTADLMIGSGGVLYFMLQFYSNSKIGFPLLSEP